MGLQRRRWYTAPLRYSSALRGPERSILGCLHRRYSAVNPQKAEEMHHTRTEKTERKPVRPDRPARISTDALHCESRSFGEHVIHAGGRCKDARLAPAQTRVGMHIQATLAGYKPRLT